MSARDNILMRVRMALRREPDDGMQTEHAHLGAHTISPRPLVDGDLTARFIDKAQQLSSTIVHANNLQQVPAAVATYLRAHALPMQAVCWPSLRMLNWAGQDMRVEARPARASDLVGITEVFCAIAETGTLMTLSGEHTPPAASLLPETHIAIVRASQIVPAMEEAWHCLRYTYGAMPRAVNFISGPSRTSDIEQTLTLGAHGPYRVHVMLVSEEE